MVRYDDRNNIYEVQERSYGDYWEHNESKNHIAIGKESAQMQSSTKKFRRVTEQG